jgi:hypothetical protein
VAATTSRRCETAYVSLTKRLDGEPKMTSSSALVPQNCNTRWESAASILTLRRDEYVVVNDVERAASSRKGVWPLAHLPAAQDALSQDLILTMQASHQSYGDYWRLQHAA